MKKLVTVSLLILVLTFAFATSIMADDLALDTAVTYAVGGDGHYAAVYATDSTGTASYYVYTVNGVDSEPTDSAEYKAPIRFGANEIYVTAYDSAGEPIAVSETIEIMGNDYGTIINQINYDFETTATSAGFSVAGTSGGGAANDRSAVINQKLEIGGDHGNVAWLKTENHYNGWEAWRPELPATDYSWFSKATGKNTFVYDFDIMPIQVGKTLSIGGFYYYNSSATEKQFAPITFTEDGKVQVVTNLGGTNPKVSFDAPANEWINFKIIMDSVHEEILLMANGVVYSSFAFDSTASEANIFDFKQTAVRCRYHFMIGYEGVPEGKSLEFYFDNIKYAATSYVERYEFEAYAQKGGEFSDLGAFPLEGGSVIVEFSEDMDVIESSDIIFEVNGEEAAFNFAFDEDSDVMTITPLGTFLGREECKISFPGVKTAAGAFALGDDFVEFTVDFPPCAITSCEADSITPGEYANFDVEVKNDLSDAKNGIIMIGVYKDGGLERVGTAPLFCDAQSETEEPCQVSCFIPEGYNSEEYDIIAYYVYQNSLYVIDFIEVLG